VQGGGGHDVRPPFSRDGLKDGEDRRREIIERYAFLRAHHRGVGVDRIGLAQQAPRA
jgi:hypothetical protein